MGDDLGDEWEMEEVDGGGEETSALDSAAGTMRANTYENAAQLRMAIIHFPLRFATLSWPLTRTQPRSASRRLMADVFLVIPLSAVRLLSFCALACVVHLVLWGQALSQQH